VEARTLQNRLHFAWRINREHKHTHEEISNIPHITSAFVRYVVLEGGRKWRDDARVRPPGRIGRASGKASGYDIPASEIEAGMELHLLAW
jgi:hypothetical protein